MLVDDLLDFLGMHLQPADIDDAGAAALEEAAVAFLLHHVVRVDKTLVVEQFQTALTDIGGRGPFGADMQRTVAQAQLDFAIGVQQRRRKSLAPIGDLEPDACLGRGVGVGNDGPGIDGAQGVENGAIGDFAGEPDIFRVDEFSVGAHQQLAPMRRRAGNMGHVGLGAADHIVPERFSRVGQ